MASKKFEFFTFSAIIFFVVLMVMGGMAEHEKELDADTRLTKLEERVDAVVSRTDPAVDWLDSRLSKLEARLQSLEQRLPAGSPPLAEQPSTEQ